MDVPPTPDQGQPIDPRPDLTEWLAGVERRLEIMGDRLARLESSIRPVVAEEVHGATSELRRAMSELGRRLVQDLPHELARHRDAIVAELRPPPPPPPPPPPEPEEDPAIVTAAQSIDLAVNEAPDSTAGRRTPRRRRRHG